MDRRAGERVVEEKDKLPTSDRRVDVIRKFYHYVLEL
jgi:hypothetical protein